MAETDNALRPYGNPLSPAWFSERMKQQEDARRREAFGAVEGDWVDVTTSESGRIYEMKVVDPSDAAVEHIYASQGAGPYRRPVDRINTVTFEDTLMEVLDEAFDLIVDRQTTYGPDNIRQQGVFGIVNRIGMDKLARIRKRLNGSVVNGEIVLEDIPLGSVNEPGIVNDFFDLIGYSVCGILLLRGNWGKPMAKDVGIDQ
jgi:hypothetical protein